MSLYGSDVGIPAHWAAVTLYTFVAERPGNRMKINHIVILSNLKWGKLPKKDSIKE